jgi:hypothetical protein
MNQFIENILRSKIKERSRAVGRQSGTSSCLPSGVWWILISVTEERVHAQVFRSDARYAGPAGSENHHAGADEPVWDQPAAEAGLQVSDGSLYPAPSRLRSLFRRSQVEEKLAEKMRDHMERLIEHHVADGPRPEEARYAALRAMDGIKQPKNSAAASALYRGLRQGCAPALRASRIDPLAALRCV